MSPLREIEDLVDEFLNSSGRQFSELGNDILNRSRPEEDNRNIWIKNVIPRLRKRMEDELSQKGAGSSPDVEAGDLGEVLERWHWLGVAAARMQRPEEAEFALRELLSTLRACQLRLGHVHKGTPFHELGWLRFNFDRTNPESCVPYFLAALIEDAIRDSKHFPSAPAGQVLSRVLWRDEALFDEVRNFVSEKLPGPPEVAELARLDPELLSLVRSTQRRGGSELLGISLHYDPAIGDQLQRFTSRHEDKTGALLELLTAYLMRTQGGFETRGRVHTTDGEHDLVMRNLNPATRVLGDYVLVECKDWKTRIGARQIKHFAQNVQAARCHTGIFVTRKGITGSGTGLSNAQFTVRRNYHRDQTILIVLDEADLARLVGRQDGLSDLLQAKYEAIRFDER